MSALPFQLFRSRADILPNLLIMGWTSLSWAASFALMAQPSPWLAVPGILLCTHAMVLAAYLVHEAAHATLFAGLPANRLIGEWMSFIAGASYASFDRIRHLHLRHHQDRADVACFDFKAVLDAQPALKRFCAALEWAYIPAIELIMHVQVIVRPFLVPSERRYRSRSALMLILRGGLLGAVAWRAPWVVPCYAVAYLGLLQVLNFFDAFHHTFEQFFVAADQPIPLDGRDRAYEQANTYSNLVSVRWPWLNLLTLNFGYHNAHHARAAAPWHRLPALHRELYGPTMPAVMPLRVLLATWHRNRVRRIASGAYGASVAVTPDPADFVGAHGVSFLTVV